MCQTLKWPETCDVSPLLSYRDEQYQRSKRETYFVGTLDSNNQPTQKVYPSVLIGDRISIFLSFVILCNNNENSMFKHENTKVY